MAQTPDDKTLAKLHDNLVAEVRIQMNRVAEIHDQRSALTDQKAEVRSALKAKGIHKDAFDMAVKYMGWDEDKRKGFDIAYQICREAAGAPFNPQQMDLFEQQAEKEPETEDA